MNYKHILFVTDLEKDSQSVADRVNELLESCQDAKLSVVHIVLDSIIASGYEIMPLFNYADDEENIQENAKSLKAFLKATDLKADRSEVVSALSTAAGIGDYAKAHEVDLIVIGLHKKSGLLNSLLGNTASAVINSTVCDVLSVVISGAE
ncbi:universal stress protein [Ostreibacterium oceani]|uniref:Universal stress protein n=1 Tax=Ostreibacterium oceani TaxID=2654998 RepID=A0A6N7EYV5_9GAMM|nr:universal stress protein [Ostreibacterium oceani]MPV86740.1 universal stress protein [Ostreibacterium oceani]